MRFGVQLLDGHEIGYSDRAALDAYGAAGATWWLENVHGEPDDVSQCERLDLVVPADVRERCADRRTAVCAATVIRWT